MKRVVTVALAVALVACTGSDPAAPPPASPTAPPCAPYVLARYDGACVDTFELDGATYRVGCVPVPEFMLDVPVQARWGRAAVRAIAAVPTSYGVAVTARDAACGAYALALRVDLPAETAAETVAEVERAAALPPDLER